MSMNACQCGAENPSDATFCFHCRAPTSSSSSPATPRPKAKKKSKTKKRK